MSGVQKEEITILGDRVLVLLEDEVKTTDSGLTLVGSSGGTVRVLDQGEVTSIGTRVEEDIKVGNIVKLKANVGSHLVLNDRDHLVVETKDILAILN